MELRKEMEEYDFSEEYPRVEFTHNPLVDVILRIDFAPILDVDTKEVLAKFQRDIKQWFPYYEMKREYFYRVDSVLWSNKPEEVLAHELGV